MYAVDPKLESESHRSAHNFNSPMQPIEKHTARAKAIKNSEILAWTAILGGRNAIGVNGFGSSLHRRTLLILPDEPAMFYGEGLQGSGIF